MRDILVDGRHFVVKEGQDVDRVIEGLRAKGKTVAKCKKPPTIKTMMKWMDDGVAKATDGCRVEPDGSCQHGHKSWLLVLGYI